VRQAQFLCVLILIQDVVTVPKTVLARIIPRTSVETKRPSKERFHCVLPAAGCKICGYLFSDCKI